MDGDRWCREEREMAEQNTKLLTLCSDVRATAVEWLWYPYIAVGKITLLQGDPGDGKSTMMMNIIAQLSHGGVLPDKRTVNIPQRIIYQCSEDDVGDTIKPRLEECGADCRNVAFINEEIHEGVTLDDERIRQAIVEFHPRLVVIDPIQAYIQSDSDLLIAARARKFMRRISMWAAAYNCAVVLIGHLNKNTGSKDLYRSLGSIDIVAAARSVLFVERCAENDHIRVVHQIKNSLAPKGEDIRFEISDSGTFSWLCSGSPLRRQSKWGKDIPKNKHELAALVMAEVLADADMESKEIMAVLKEYRIGSKTIQETKTELGITSYRKMRKWYWHMER